MFWVFIRSALNVVGILKERLACLWHTLEPPHRGVSNEYDNMLLLRNKIKKKKKNKKKKKKRLSLYPSYLEIFEQRHGANIYIFSASTFDHLIHFRVRSSLKGFFVRPHAARSISMSAMAFTSPHKIHA